MKKFCGCNSKWEGLPINFAERVTQLVCGLTREGTQECEVCCYCKWYNPQYENMMYDLKWMNQ